MRGAVEAGTGPRVPMIRADAIWRSPADSYWLAGGEPCEVLEADRDGAAYRILFADGEEMCVPGEELDFGEPVAHVSVCAGQAALEVGEA